MEDVAHASPLTATIRIDLLMAGTAMFQEIGYIGCNGCAKPLWGHNVRETGLRWVRSAQSAGDDAQVNRPKRRLIWRSE